MMQQVTDMFNSIKVDEGVDNNKLAHQDNNKQKERNSISDEDVDFSSDEIEPRRLTDWQDLEFPDDDDIQLGLYNYKHVAASDSEYSDSGSDCRETCSILFQRKKRVTTTKVNLESPKFNVTLPSRVSTRVRKPVASLHHDEKCLRKAKILLESRFLNSPEKGIDEELLTENLRRLKKLHNERIAARPKTNVTLTENKQNITENKQNITPAEEVKRILKKSKGFKTKRNLIHHWFESYSTRTRRGKNARKLSLRSHTKIRY